MASIRTSTRATSDGFTLVELALVLLIVGILFSLVVPRVTLLGQARVDASARRLATLISYLHDESALRGRIYRLTLDLDEELYSVETQAPYASGRMAEQPVVVWDPYANGTRLPDNVDLASVETADAKRSSGVAEIYFLPEDALGGVTITLTGDGGRSVVLAIDGVTGQVRIEPAEALL